MGKHCGRFTGAMKNLEALYRRAEEIAIRAHAGQVDKGGNPYINHPLAVAAGVQGYELKIVALLHDVLEDSSVTAQDLLAEGFPPELVPLSIIRMFSSSAATGLALDIYKEYGQDSRMGLITSIMMSCTETVFYTMSVYFMTAKVKKTRYTLTGALLASFSGIAASIFLADLL